MADDARASAPVRDTAPARLAELADLLGGESSRSKRFLGGLVVGALAGAALAGATVLSRRLSALHGGEPPHPPRAGSS
jgi:hypothetical protein